jgi:hypothetical protein
MERNNKSGLRLMKPKPMKNCTISERKRWFFEKINNIANMTKWRRNMIQINKIRD